MHVFPPFHFLFGYYFNLYFCLDVKPNVHMQNFSSIIGKTLLWAKLFPKSFEFSKKIKVVTEKVAVFAIVDMEKKIQWALQEIRQTAEKIVGTEVNPHYDVIWGAPSRDPLIMFVGLKRYFCRFYRK